MKTVALIYTVGTHSTGLYCRSVMEVHSEYTDLSPSDPISNQHGIVHVCSVPPSLGQKSEAG